MLFRILCLESYFPQENFLLESEGQRFELSAFTSSLGGIMPTGVWWGAGAMHPRGPMCACRGCQGPHAEFVPSGSWLGCVCDQSAKVLNGARNVGGKAHGWFSWQGHAAGVWALGRSPATAGSWHHRSGLVLALLSGFLWLTSGFG